MGLLSSMFSMSLSRSSDRRRKSHRGSHHYKRRGLSFSSVYSHRNHRRQRSSSSGS